MKIRRYSKPIAMQKGQLGVVDGNASLKCTRRQTKKFAQLAGFALLVLMTTAGLGQSRKIVPVFADDYSKLMWYQAELHGLPPQKAPDVDGVTWGTQQWTRTDQTATWTLEVTEPGEYAVSLMYLCAGSGAGSTVEVNLEGTQQRVGETLHATGNAWRKPGWELQSFPGLLRLEAGRHDLTFRIVTKHRSGEVLQLRSLELVKPSIRDKMETRAKELRSDSSWMVAAKYGLMTHWTPLTEPRRGEQVPYCEAVRNFNVDSYVKMVRETGAGYLVFTTGWGGFWFPAPIRAVNEALPGHGCDHDLIMELANQLQKHDIKLILYFGWNIGIDSYREAWGKDLGDWPPKLSALLEEVGQRYGTKLIGFFFDGGYESKVYPYRFPYENITRAAKTGNPNRLVSYNHWIFPKLTSFQDYWIGESAHDLLPPPGRQAFQKGGFQEGMQAHLNTFLDDFDWCHTKANTDMLPPWHSTEEVVSYVERAVAEGTVPTLNISIYQDGTVQDATLKQMKAVRLAVRGDPNST